MSCCDPSNQNYKHEIKKAAAYASKACECKDAACECKDLAEQYAQNAEDTWNDFQTRYLGAYAVAPVTSTTGALYFNSVSNTMFVWNGTSWQTADFNEFTAFIATGTTTARNLVTRTSDIFNVKDFGAIGDGVFDCQTAFQAAINAALAAGGGTIYIPKGTYNFPNTSTSAKLDPGLGNLTFKGDGYTSSILKYWEGTGNDQQGNLFANTTNNPTKGGLIFKDLQIQGSLLTRSGRFGNPLWLDYYSEVLIDSCKFYNIAGMGMDFHFCKSFKCVNSHFENIAADAIRARDTFDCIITGNKILRNGDDAIALHTSATAIPVIRERIVISNNQIVNSGVIRCIAARKTIISNNNLALSGSINLFSYYLTAEGGQEIFDIIVSNNVITDSIDARSSVSSISQRIGFFSNTKSSSTTNNTIPGDYNSTTSLFVLPYDYTQTSSIEGESVPRNQNIICSNNTMSITRSGVSQFSDFGYGTRLFQGVSYNYAVTSSQLYPASGIVFYGQYENVVIANNVIKDSNYGINIGANIFIDPNDSSTKYIKNLLINSNSLYNTNIRGIIVSAASGNDNHDITISNNLINCDPYKLYSNSNINGSYYSDSTPPQGIYLEWSRGVKIHNNKFKNCCQLIASNVPSLNYISNNIAHCSTPVSSGFNVGNKGIGNILVDNNWVYVIEDSDPTSATYLNVTQITIETASAMPSTGWYYRGWFVKNTTPSLDANNMSILGWLRLTTGTGHVSGTDWAIARVSHVSPAT